MKFNSPLINATFKKRYKRFFVDCELNSELVTAHLANTGSMKTCYGENWPILLSTHNSITRKLKYSVEMIHNGKTWIGVNTSLTNKLAKEAIENGVIKELEDYTEIHSEVKIGESRIDFLVMKNLKKCYVEVKNVTLVNDKNECLFPDSVSERALKHLQELIQLKENNIRAILLFIVQREDCNIFQMNNEIDLKYSELLKVALKKGVEILVYQCSMKESEIKVAKKLELALID